MGHSDGIWPLPLPLPPEPPRQWSLPNQVYFECVSKLRKIPGMTVHQPPELTLTSYGLITNRAHPHGGQHNPQQDKDYKPECVPGIGSPLCALDCSCF